MSLEPQQKKQKIFSIIEAKSLLSNGDEAGALAVLKKAAERGDVMACYDAGFMMIQGIGCEMCLEEGIGLINKGMNLEKDSKDLSWKSCESVSGLFQPQSMDLNGLFL